MIVEVDDEQKRMQQELENLESIEVSDDSREQVGFLFFNARSPILR